MLPSDEQAIETHAAAGVLVGTQVSPPSLETKSGAATPNVQGHISPPTANFIPSAHEAKQVTTEPGTLKRKSQVRPVLVETKTPIQSPIRSFVPSADKAKQEPLRRTFVLQVVPKSVD